MWWAVGIAAWVVCTIFDIFITAYIIRAIRRWWTKKVPDGQV